MTGNRSPVGYAEAVAIITYFVNTKVFLSYHLVAVDRAATAAWQVVLLVVLLGGAALLAVLARLLRSFPGQSIVDVGETVAGPWFNSLFVLGYLAFFLTGAGLQLRQFSEQILIGFNPETPISVVVFSYLTGVGVAAYLGLEVIARTARLFFWFEWISFALILLGTIPFWDFEALWPLLGNGPLSVLSGGLNQLGLVSDLFLLAVIYPFIPHERTRDIGRAVILHGAAALTLLVLVLLLAFPYPVAREIPLASYELSRLIYLGRFVQRMETLFLPMWAVAGLVSTATGLWAAAYVTSRALRLPHWRPLLPAVMVLVVAVAFIAPNVTAAIRLENEFLRRYFAPVIAFGIPIILVLLARRRRRWRRD